MSETVGRIELIGRAYHTEGGAMVSISSRRCFSKASSWIMIAWDVVDLHRNLLADLFVNRVLIHPPAVDDISEMKNER